MKKVIVTGGAGFAGSHLAIAVKAAYPACEVIAFDNLLRRGSERNLPRLADAGVSFRHGDVRQPSDLEECGPADFLIECSAEPSVLAGSEGSPQYVLQTNLNGAINCAEYCRRHEAGLLFLSTSRVYSVNALSNIKVERKGERFVPAEEQNFPGITASGISEDFPTAGYKSFYGASKFAAETMLEEYRQLYDWPLIINRCGILAGPWQFGKSDQGIIPFWIKAHMQQQPLKYIGFGGEGLQVRDALHIDDGPVLACLVEPPG